ncbi:MAG: HlyD family efflux transporter periplasmic adaptor subunit [Planctomycetes bacterium]|nr:HlyD family efflux transporter periplasmic adaptor subunit [Planctomycetota bacterium]
MIQPGRTKLIAAAAGASVLAIGGYYYFTAGKKSFSFEGIPIAKVIKGPLRISTVERGNLKAKKTTVIRSELEGESKILYVVPEGRNVKQGELLIELDVSTQVEKQVQQKISFDEAEASLIDAKEKLAIQQSTSEGAIQKSRVTLEIAQINLEKYIKGTLPQKKEAQEAKITLAAQSLAQAQERYEWSKKLFDAGFLTKIEFEHDELDVNRNKIDLELAKRDLDLIVIYEAPTEQKLFESDIAEDKRELDRAIHLGAAEKAQAEAFLRAREQTLDLEREKLKKLETQISRSKILAPTDGVVVYASQSNNGGRRQDEMITIGARVSEREELLELPDPSRMIAEAKFHESVVDTIEVGQPAIVTVDPAPEKPLAAKVSYLSVVPDSQSRWMNPDLRVYRAEVEIEVSTEEFRPQMSCAIEIVVKDIPDAVYVPVQAIFRRAGKPICYVMTGTTATAREVEVGLTNERNVQIKTGVVVGDVVLLSLPPGMSSDLAVESPKTQVGEVVDGQQSNTASKPGRGKGMMGGQRGGDGSPSGQWPGNGNNSRRRGGAPGENIKENRTSDTPRETEK